MNDIPAAVLADAAGAPLAPPDRLEQVRAELAAQRDDLKELADLEIRRQDVKARLEKRRFDILPALLMAAGTDQVGLPAAGNLPAYDARLKPYYRANIAAEWPEEKREAAFDLLEAKHGGDIIKCQVIVEFNREQLDAAYRLASHLEHDWGYRPAVRRTVQWNTITAWFREQVESHRGFTGAEMDALGATHGHQVELKERKT
jgi:hypothetical protein